MLCQVIDHMVMRESQPQATGSGLRRACGRACGSSNLVDDLDLLHASMKIRSSFAECRVQNQLSAQDLASPVTPHQGEAEMGRRLRAWGPVPFGLAGLDKRRVCLRAGLSAKVEA